MDRAVAAKQRGDGEEHCRPGDLHAGGERIEEQAQRRVRQEAFGPEGARVREDGRVVEDELGADTDGRASGDPPEDSPVSVVPGTRAHRPQDAVVHCAAHPERLANAGAQVRKSDEVRDDGQRPTLGHDAH